MTCTALPMYQNAESDLIHQAVEKINTPCLHILQAAADEVAAIRSRHDGVHVIHGIYCAMLGYQQFAAAGLWTQVLQEGFETQLVRARQIDRTGFDAKHYD